MSKKRNNRPMNIRNAKVSKTSFIISCVVLIFLVLVFRQLDHTLIVNPRKAALAKEKEEKLKKEQEQKEKLATKHYTANIVAVGNNSFSSSVINALGDNVSNYAKIYGNVSDLISASDLGIIPESTLIAESKSDNGTTIVPAVIGEPLTRAGFKAIAAATHNIYNDNIIGIVNTLHFWDKYKDVSVTGISPSTDKAHKFPIFNVNNIKIAVLSYTEDLATELGEKDKFAVNIFDKASIAKDIAAAKDKSDCVIFCANWDNNNEKDNGPSQFQKQLANFLLDQGVDVLIGTRPNTLSPYVKLTNKSGKSMAIFYSLGNFFNTRSSLGEIIGGIGSFTIDKTEKNGKVTINITNMNITPTVTHFDYDNNNFSIYPLNKYTDELCKTNNASYEMEEPLTLDSLNKKFVELMSTSVEPAKDSSYPNDGAPTAKDNNNQAGNDDSSVHNSNDNDNNQYDSSNNDNVDDYSSQDDSNQ